MIDPVEEGGQGNVARVVITEAAAAVLRRLEAQHGPLLFHQSGGCCDGSAPMCFPRGEFRLGEWDVLLGELEGTPFYIGGQQYEAWKHTQLLIDVVPGCGSGFSLEAPLGMRFLTRSRVFDPAEQAWLETCSRTATASAGPPRGLGVEARVRRRGRERHQADHRAEPGAVLNRQSS